MSYFNETGILSIDFGKILNFQILMKLEFYRQILEKTLKYQILMKLEFYGRILEKILKYQILMKLEFYRHILEKILKYQILMKLEFYRQILEKKYSNTKFHKNPSSGGHVVPCERTDGHAFSKYAAALKK